ncbi:MAG: hypothetical protein ACE5J2_04745 [Nitrososphaerales archaeon]
MDWRVFALGISMVVPGILISILVNQNVSALGSYTSPIPSPGYANTFLTYPELGKIGSIVGAIGVLLTLVSFGLGKRKKRPDDEALEKYKPDEPS